MPRKPGLQLAIKSADFLPKRLPAKPASVVEMLLGRLIGEATGTFFVPDPNDPTKPPFEGISGMFQFTDAEDENRILQAVKLWVPDMISIPVMEALRDPETGEVRAKAVEIAFDVYAIRSSAPLGYTWKAVPVFEPTENPDHDPIARIARKAEQALLAAPEAGVNHDEPTTLAKVEAVAGGARKK